MATCGECKKSCSKYTDYLKCCVCESSFHIECLGISHSQFEAIRRRSSAGDSWFCGYCRGGAADFSIENSAASVSIAPSPADASGLSDSSLRSREASGLPDANMTDSVCKTICGFIESTIKPEFAILKLEIEDLKSQNKQLREDLAKVRDVLLGNTESGCKCVTKTIPSYAAVAAAKSVQSVAIRPKKPDHPVSQTKSDILKNINPLAAGIHINKVKPIRDGGVVVGSSEADEFRRIAAEKLSDCYEVHQLKTLSPSVRVVGISRDVDKDLIVPYILKQNESIFLDASACSLVSLTPTKRKPGVLQATLRVDAVSYKSVLEAGHLLVGFDVCNVYDAVSPVRCFRCNGFNHTSKYCKGKLSCPRCGQQHEVKDCKEDNADHFQCVNCKELNARSGGHHPTNHAAWDSVKCAAIKLISDKLKKDLFNITQ